MNAHYIPGEPPNRLTERDINRLDPITSPPCGEDRRKGSEIFNDTGHTMESFVRASKQVAEFLRNV